jgi:hypothetical protein
MRSPGILLVGAVLIAPVLVAFQTLGRTNSEDAAVYRAVLMHVDSVLRSDAPMVVHPAVLRVVEGKPAAGGHATEFLRHPHDAVRRAVTHVPGIAICRQAANGLCEAQSRVDILMLSAVNWEDREHPQVWLVTMELFPQSFSGQIIEVQLERHGREWKVQRFVRWSQDDGGVPD